MADKVYVVTTKDIEELLETCSLLDDEASMSGRIEGSLGTSLIRHILRGHTLEDYNPSDPDTPLELCGECHMGTYHKLDCGMRY